MGRDKLPLEVLEFNGNSHLTKDEIEKRKKSEIKAPSQNIVPPKYLKKKQKEKFNELAEILKEIGVMTDLDCDALGRYIVAEDQQIELGKKIKKLPDDVNPKTYESLLAMRAKYLKVAKELGAELGLSAISRCKLVAPKAEEKPENKFKKLDVV